MFTGIVEELGHVAAVENLSGAARLTIRGGPAAEGLSRGDSIAVSGACLTVVGVAGATFTADVMGETLRRTTLGALAPGSPVNLERAMRLDGRLGGHLVQGHVDAVGAVVSRTPADHWEVVRFAAPPPLARYLVEKGSVAVDGVSLTVSATAGDAGPRGESWFEVGLIPTTLELTTLGGLRPGSGVNLEADVIAKYVERLTRGEAAVAWPPPGEAAGARP